MQLSHRTIVITGATSGIGEACAKLFAEHGAKLVLIGRRDDRLHALADSLPVDMALPVPLDVRDKNAVEQALGHLPPSFASVDGLINNAGLAKGVKALQDEPLEDLEQMIDTNVKGMTYVTKALLPIMLELGKGHIVNIGSTAGTYPYPGSHVYGGTKAFVKQFSLGLRADLLGTPIRVTNLEPAMTKTEFSEVRIGDKKQAEDVYQGMQPLLAEDIASAIFYCLTCPAHVNVNRMEIMPTQQAFGPYAVDRKKA